MHQDEITYSVCASVSRFPVLGKTISETYRKLSQALLESLRFLGVEGEWVKPSAESKYSPSSFPWSKPCFLSSSRYELTVGGKKVIGSAQRRFSLRSAEQEEQSFIQHGSILTGKGKFNLADFLPDKSSSDRVKSDLSEMSTDLQTELGRKISLDEMASSIEKGFEKTFGSPLEKSEVSESELRMAQSLSRDKYGKNEWNLRI